MTDQNPAPIAGYSLSDFLPAARNIISQVSAVLVTIGVMKTADQASLIDAVTHISTDIVDIAKYVGIIGMITMPVWAHLSSSIIPLIKMLHRKAPAVQIVAPPKIAAVTPASSSAEVTVVSKVSGQEVT